MQIYFNPLDTACKSKIGGLLRKEKIQFNVYLLNENEEYVAFSEKTGEFHAKTPLPEQCHAPKNDAFLCLNKDGEHAEFFSMEKTEFGWTITLSISEIGLYFYSFYIENKGNIACGYSAIVGREALRAYLVLELEYYSCGGLRAYSVSACDCFFVVCSYGKCQLLG